MNKLKTPEAVNALTDYLKTTPRPLVNDGIQRLEPDFQNDRVAITITVAWLIVNEDQPLAKIRAHFTRVYTDTTIKEAMRANAIWHTAMNRYLRIQG